MREGIIEQLPKRLESDDLVVIYRSENEKGQGSLKAVIDELDRRGKWIRDIVKSDVSEVPKKASVVIITGGVSPGSFNNIRRAASKAGACCPLQAISLPETKDILRLLSERRQPEDIPKKPESNPKLRAEIESFTSNSGHGTGNGHHPATSQFNPGVERGKNPADIHVGANNDRTDPEQPADEVGSSPDEPAAVVTTSEEQEIEAALACIDSFREESFRVDSALLIISEKLKKSMARCVELEVEVAQIREQLTDYETLQKAHTDLQTRTGKLQSDYDTCNNWRKMIEKAVESSKK